jgi:hypothetical protein
LPFAFNLFTVIGCRLKQIRTDVEHIGGHICASTRREIRNIVAFFVILQSTECVSPTTVSSAAFAAVIDRHLPSSVNMPPPASASRSASLNFKKKKEFMVVFWSRRYAFD